MAVPAAKEEMDYSIKPEAIAPSIPTADWPLLLKNYEKRMLGFYRVSFLSIVESMCPWQR